MALTDKIDILLNLINFANDMLMKVRPRRQATA